jgi:hypothetical protein
MPKGVCRMAKTTSIKRKMLDEDIERKEEASDDLHAATLSCQI